MDHQDKMDWLVIPVLSTLSCLAHWSYCRSNWSTGNNMIGNTTYNIWRLNRMNLFCFNFKILPFSGRRDQSTTRFLCGCAYTVKPQLLGGPLCSSGFDRRSSTAAFCFVRLSDGPTNFDFSQSANLRTAVFGSSTWNKLPGPLRSMNTTY